MSRWSQLKRTFLFAFAVAGIGVVIAACGDSVSGPEREPGTILRSGSCPPGMACLPGVVVTAESSEGDCDPFDWSCGSAPCATDPWSCSDPCSVDPWAPGCGNDECSMYPSLPGCPGDPCTYDPYACSGGGEIGTTGGTEPSGELEICPSRDPNCLRAFDAGEKQAVRNGIDQVKTQFNDPKVKEICQRLQTEARSMLDAGTIMEGNKAIADGPKGEDHDGEYDPQSGKIHIDEAWLDQAMALGASKAIGALVLHEVAHKLGYQHGTGEAFPYTSFPFRHTSYAGGGSAESCW